MPIDEWTPPTARAVPDEALDCFHVHIGDDIFASHVDEHEARSIETVMNGIAPLTAAARAVIEAAALNPPADIHLVDALDRLARALPQPANLDE